MEKIESCFICGSKEFLIFLDCKDHFLSQEKFKIIECENCGFKFISPRPDENEIGKYYQSEEYISHSGNKKGLVNLVYQIIKNYTIPKKFLLINKYSKGKTILDIGCATGEFLNFFKSRNWRTFGIEPNEKAREFANENFGLDVYEENKIKKFENNYFDVITMWHVLEHVHNLNERVGEIKRILKNDGILFVALPNPDSFDAKYYKEYWAGYDVPRHLYHFNKLNVKELFDKFDMKIIQKIPMKFDAFYISLLSEKYKTGRKNWFRGLYNGWISNLSGMKSNNHSSLIYLIKNK